MAISNASAQWTGGLKDGKGVMKPAHAPEAAFTLASRFEGAPTTEAAVPGVDAARFQQIAEETKRGCPVSKALAGTKIALSAKLT